MIQDNSKLTKVNLKAVIGTPLESLARDALKYCTYALHTYTIIRGDYKELCELIVFLGGVVDEFQFKRPGACHHAR